MKALTAGAHDGTIVSMMVLITETLALQDYARNKYNTCVTVCH